MFFFFQTNFRNGASIYRERLCGALVCSIRRSKLEIWIQLTYGNTRSYQATPLLCALATIVEGGAENTPRPYHLVYRLRVIPSQSEYQFVTCRRYSCPSNILSIVYHPSNSSNLFVHIVILLREGGSVFRQILSRLYEALPSSDLLAVKLGPNSLAVKTTKR